MFLTAYWIFLPMIVAGLATLAFKDLPLAKKIYGALLGLSILGVIVLGLFYSAENLGFDKTEEATSVEVFSKYWTEPDNRSDSAVFADPLNDAIQIDADKARDKIAKVSIISRVELGTKEKIREAILKVKNETNDWYEKLFYYFIYFIGAMFSIHILCLILEKSKNEQSPASNEASNNTSS
jgi:hypothetical protein